MSVLGNVSVTEYSDYVPFVGPDFYKEVIITIAYILFILITVIENLFVMIAYATDEKINQQVSNLILLHLAIADFIVGAFTLTCNLPFLLYMKWLFGRTYCRLWATLDYVSVSVSSSMIACFTADRFLMVTKTLEYRAVQTRSRIKLILFFIWIVIIALNVCLEFGWLALTGLESTIDYSTDCYPEYRHSALASFMFSTVTGYIPLILVADMNILIVLHLRKQVRKLFKDDSLKPGHSDLSSSQPPSISILDKESSVNPKLIKIRTVSQSAMESHRKDAEEPRTTSTSTAADPASPSFPKGQVGRKQCVQDDIMSHTRKMQVLRYRRNVRAAIQLGVIVTIVAICWLPYEILSAFWAFGNGAWITDIYWQLTANIQYANSAINPLLYATTNRQFRINFIKYLSLGRWG